MLQWLYTWFSTVTHHQDCNQYGSGLLPALKELDITITGHGT